MEFVVECWDNGVLVMAAMEDGGCCCGEGGDLPRPLSLCLLLLVVLFLEVVSSLLLETLFLLLDLVVLLASIADTLCSMLDLLLLLDAEADGPSLPSGQGGPA